MDKALTVIDDRTLLNPVEVLLENMHRYRDDAIRYEQARDNAFLSGDSKLATTYHTAANESRAKAQAAAIAAAPYISPRKTPVRIKMDDPASMSDAELIEYLADIPEIEEIISGEPREQPPTPTEQPKQPRPQPTVFKGRVIDTP